MIIFDNPATVPAPAGQYRRVARVELGGSRTSMAAIQLLEYVPAILAGPPGTNTVSA